MSYSVVVPVYNEAENIGAVVTEILASTREDPPEAIVVVDDGSTDDTVAVVRQLRREHVGIVRLIRNSGRCGQTAAVHNGVDAAESRWIVTLDGDGQNPASDIPAMLAALRECGRDDVLVIGHRIHRHDSPLRRIASRVANAVRSRLLHDGVPDTGCGMKAFTRRMYQRLPYFDHMHRFMPALVRQQGGHVISLPVHHRAREAGVSKYKVADRFWIGITDLLGVAWLIRRSPRTEWSIDDA